MSLSRNYRYPLISTNTSHLLVLALLFTLLLVVHNPLVSSSVFNGVFIVDWLSTIAKISILASSIGCLLISSGYVKTYRINNFEYFVIVRTSIYLRWFVPSSLTQHKFNMNIFVFSHHTSWFIISKGTENALIYLRISSIMLNRNIYMIMYFTLFRP